MKFMQMPRSGLIYIDFLPSLSYISFIMIRKIINLLSSTKVALVLLIVISLSCVIGVSLPRAIGKEVVFSSGWFNLLLVFLIVNIVWCIGKRTPVLRLSQAGTTVFHLGLVLLFAGAVYDQLFFF